MNKESRLLRVGILGCGPISQVGHFDACRKARNAELYALCDVADDLVERMAAVHSPRTAYRNYEDMLADPQVEAVLIGTADQFHVECARQALEAGKHVLVEKPLGTTVEECESLRRTALDRRRMVQIGTNRRFDPGIQFASRFIREEMGGLIALKAWYCDSVYRYAMTDNLQPQVVRSAKAKRPAENPKADKGRYFMLTHGSHLVDTARFLGGEMVRVQARKVEKDDSHCWFVSVEYAGGALGHLDLIVPLRGDFNEGFQVYGEQGSVVGKTHLPWYHKTSEVECFSARDGIYRRPIGEDAHTYKRQIEAFADTILHGAPQQGANVDDGVAAMRAMAAIARSIEAGGAWVRLSEATGGV